MSDDKPERGFGKIFKRPGSPYWYIGWSVGGKFYRRSTRSTNKAVARRLLKKKLGEAVAGKDPSIERVTFADMRARILTDYVSNEKKSVTRVKRSITNLGAVFDDSDTVPAITEARIESFKAVRLEDGAANATINRELAALKRMLKLTGAHPMPTIRMLRERNARTGFFEREQLDQIVEHLPDYIRPLVIAGYITGWRINSELRTRTWVHVDLRKRGWLRLEPGETKNDEGREFPLLTPLREVLEERRHFHRLLRIKGIDSPWVFPNAKGQRIGLKRYYEAWATAAEKAKLDRIPHDFRRTAVRKLERSGIPRSTAMKMVGHRTESIYRRYAIVTSKDLEDAADKLEKVLELETSSVT